MHDNYKLIILISAFSCCCKYSRHRVRLARYSTRVAPVQLQPCGSLFSLSSLVWSSTRGRTRGVPLDVSRSEDYAEDRFSPRYFDQFHDRSSGRTFHTPAAFSRPKGALLYKAPFHRMHQAGPKRSRAAPRHATPRHAALFSRSSFIYFLCVNRI